MELSFKDDVETATFAVCGVVDSASAGQLLDAVVAACLNMSGKTLIVDLCGVTRMTRAGVRGFVVAAKLAQYRGGTLHITGARPSVESVLESLGYTHLFRFDQTQAGRAAIARRAA